jgi:dihydrofolate reductase
MYLDKKISIIVAVADNGVIGNKGELPWNIPEDLARFHEITLGGSVIMGRKTLESIGHPLTMRQNIILSKKGAAAIQNVELGDQKIWVTNSLKGAIGLAENTVFVIGGQKAYKEAIEFADTVYLTRVHQKCAGDRFFKFEDEGWKITEEIAGNGYTFYKYER